VREKVEMRWRWTVELGDFFVDAIVPIASLKERFYLIQTRLRQPRPHSDAVETTASTFRRG